MEEPKVSWDGPRLLIWAWGAAMQAVLRAIDRGHRWGAP